MTRAERLQWCKDRALAYVDAGDLDQAIASMGSDLRSHEETRDHAGIGFMFQMQFAGLLGTPEEVRKMINDFN